VGPEKPKGESRILRSAILADNQELFKDFRGMSTLKQIVEKNAKDSPNKPLLGSRVRITDPKTKETSFGIYQWKTYQHVYEDSLAVAKYVQHYKLAPKISNSEGTFRFISLYSKNRQEWVETDIACILSGLTSVTLYDTLGKESIEYILDQTQIKTVFCSADKIINILDLKKQGKLPTVTHIIYFDDFSGKEQDTIEASASAKVALVKWEECVAEGKQLQEISFDDVTPETCYTFSYTSGTTGMPKGVMLTHRNFVANIESMTKFDGSFNLYETDTYISYLPLAHVMERLLMTSSLSYKLQYGFYSGDVLKIKEDLAALKPTIMVSVPRLYNRFFDLMQ
jgi:long-chain acyl-CoA synthetase